ncbi:MAG: ABC transporter ATP-binding protein [Chloroflexi bacterium]|nr:ABC transporter ATP-binding protein [Chloroflexota bacterium]
MLEIEELHSYYGLSHVVQGVSLTVGEGRLVALLGRNGMGKTTLIRSIMGTEPPTVRQGSARYRGRELVGLAPYQIARAGLGLVPQGRHVFRSLSVVENLTVAAREGRKDASERWTVDRVFTLFPRLAERQRNRGAALSGGEQQMLAVGRALMTNPDLLLMDEPSEGLAPIMVQQLGRQLLELKQTSLSILLVEQNLGLALKLADEVYILERGRIVHHGSPAELEADEDAKHRFLGVA